MKLIKEFEGCRLTAYQDQRGIWTIGYGHTANVKSGDVCTQAQADAWLEQEYRKLVQIISKYHLNQNQLDACVSLAYNIGIGNFIHSTVLIKIQAGDYVAAADAFLLWDKTNGQVNAGLLRRRTAERSLFLQPISEVNN